MVLLKKIVIAMMLTLSFALFSSPSFADQKWDAFVAKMEQRAKIKEVGLPIIEALRQSAPQGSEEELWLMTKRGETKSRAAAAAPAAGGGPSPAGRECPPGRCRPCAC